ncbi:trypsin-like peptidase domain-containing protein [Leptolyngbya sp. FACHB-261]|uniref:trypsin-like peptidase domain-containing protein n=1 Tax=Leptolyngbya sp. FACHB-261 TaxID=2692806 RepID=UPI00168834D7|nr:trypsin-like peptidase domain-containing protein [Leptolyngbya sp. FACHB-261]MBD2102949.1 trypsin-like peptidase domain-containing protein [Leptolyngbya sp. FACHB-261]
MYLNLLTSLVAPALLVAQLPFSQQPQPSADKRLAMYAKPAVVRIVAGCYGTYSDGSKSYPLSNAGLGSGYFINPNGYIVTNAHVVEATREGEQGCKKRLFQKLVVKLTGIKNINDVPQTRQAAIEERFKLDSASFDYVQRVVLPNTDGNFPRYEIKSFGTAGSGGSGKDIAVIKIEVKNAPALPLGDSDKVELQDNVMVLGYPGAADSFRDFSKKSVYEATVVKGAVSSSNKTLADDAPVLQLDALVTYGSSGGPVLNERGEVVGMITFGGRDEDGAVKIPFAVTTSTIQEFIGQSGTANEKGVIDDLYRKGLELYWQGDYRQAKAKFEAVKGLFPQHSDINRLLGECDQKLADGWKNGDPFFWLLLTAVLVAVPSLGYFLLNRNAMPRFSAVGGHSNVELDESNEQSFSPPIGVPNSSHRYPLQQPTITSVAPQLKLNRQGKTLQFALDQEVYHLGRERGWSDFEIPDAGWEVISRRHAVLRREGDNYRIYDGDGQTPSRNGIFVDQVQIDGTKGYLLNHGCQIKLGQNPATLVTLTYSNPASQQTAAAPTNVDMS